jgi:hypothetical protein
VEYGREDERERDGDGREEAQPGLLRHDVSFTS